MQKWVCNKPIFFCDRGISEGSTVCEMLARPCTTASTKRWMSISPGGGIAGSDAAIEETVGGCCSDGTTTLGCGNGTLHAAAAGSCGGAQRTPTAVDGNAGGTAVPAAAAGRTGGGATVPTVPPDLLDASITLKQKKQTTNLVGFQQKHLSTSLFLLQHRNTST